MTSVKSALDKHCALVEDYLHDYEFDPGEGCAYLPTEHERKLIQDAIYGLFADQELLDAFNAWQDLARAAPDAPAAQPVVEQPDPTQPMTATEFDAFAKSVPPSSGQHAPPPSFEPRMIFAELLSAAQLTLTSFNVLGLSMPEDVGDALVVAIRNALAVHPAAQPVEPRLKCESKGGSDYCYWCSRDMGSRLENPYCSYLTRQHPEAATAFGCANETEEGNERCQRWCGSHVCPVSFNAPETSPAAQPVEPADDVWDDWLDVAYERLCLSCKGAGEIPPTLPTFVRGLIGMLAPTMGDAAMRAAGDKP